MALADLRNYAPGKGAGTMQASGKLVYGVYTASLGLYRSRCSLGL